MWPIIDSSAAARRIAELEAEIEGWVSGAEKERYRIIALRHKVAYYGNAARHYRLTMRGAREAVRDMWKTQRRLTTAEKLLRKAANCLKAAHMEKRLRSDIAELLEEE